MNAHIQLVGAMAMMLRDTQTIPESIMALVDLISVPEILGAAHWDDDPESFTFLIKYEVWGSVLVGLGFSLFWQPHTGMMCTASK